MAGMGGQYHRNTHKVLKHMNHINTQWKATDLVMTEVSSKFSSADVWQYCG